jgi:ferredoxin
VALLPALARRRWSPAVKALALLLVAGGFGVLHRLLCAWPGISDWLAATESPMVAIFLTVVMPAMYLPRDRWYPVFLLLPLALVLHACAQVVANCLTGPPGWHWFPVRPAWLIGGVASLLVLVQPLLRLRHFRFVVRLTCFLVLTYGGCALRSSARDYREAVARREGIVIGVITDTVPALQNDRRMTYLPSAPCRFTADGGYVQGCNMEMAQRVMQVNWLDGSRRAEAIGSTSLLLGALVLFLAMSLIAARWFCGWLCPLSFIGDVLDRVRRLLRLPHLKPSRPVKLAYFSSGLGLAGIGLLMAKLQPHVDPDTGAIAGCKIPLYPFCKICPSQPICSTVGRGAPEYSPVPTTDMGFGFFTTFYLLLLAVFVLSFAAGRRLWCRLCPMGMISGIFNRGGFVKLRKDPLKCNSCGVCAEVCPMDIDLVRSEMVGTDVSSFDCVLCLKCVEKCPRDGCLGLEHAGVTVTESRFDGGN